MQIFFLIYRHITKHNFLPSLQAPCKSIIQFGRFKISSVFFVFTLGNGRIQNITAGLITMAFQKTQTLWTYSPLLMVQKVLYLTHKKVIRIGKGLGHGLHQNQDHEKRWMAKPMALSFPLTQSCFGRYQNQDQGRRCE